MKFHCRSNHCDSDSNDCDVRLRHAATAVSDGDHLHHSHHPHQHLCYLLPAVISAFIFTKIINKYYSYENATEKDFT